MDGVFVDTSSILFAFSNKIDIFKKIEEQIGSKPAISKGVIKELKKMSSSKKLSKKYAIVALAMIEKYKIMVDEGSDYVDKWIIDNADRFEGVCTNDIKLKRALKSKGIITYSISIGGTIK